MRFKARWAGKVLFGLVALAALGGMVMLLWNAVMPQVFDGARTIGYLQALGLLVLSRILFGGFRGGWRRWPGHGGWNARWHAMTDEERDEVRRRLGGHRHAHGGEGRGA